MRKFLIVVLFPVLFVLSCKKEEKTTEVSSVTLSISAAEMCVGETTQLKATVLPAEAVNRNVTWASTKQSVATVSSTGLVTAVSEGTAVITATAGGVQGSCRVTVTKEGKIPEVSAVILSLSAAEMVVGETLELKVSVLPTDAGNKEVTWASTKQSVATVTQEGLVTAVAEGTATITATAGGFQGSCKITVSERFIEVSSISLDKEAVEIQEGTNIALKATVLPEDASDPSVTWTSSKEEVAVVSSTGVVAGVSLGTAIITATAGEKTAACVVTVTERLIHVESLKLNKSETTIIKGETETLIATILPIDVSDNTVLWGSSDNAVAMVDENGTITAVAAGEADIIAKADGVEATCHVTVIVLTEALLLDRTSAEVYEDETLQLVATILPEDATDREITWSSSDEKVAIVDGNGTVTGVFEGDAVIKAVSSGFEATCTLEVLTHRAPLSCGLALADKTQLWYPTEEEVPFMLTDKVWKIQRQYAKVLLDGNEVDTISEETFESFWEKGEYRLKTAGLQRGKHKLEIAFYSVRKGHLFTVGQVFYTGVKYEVRDTSAKVIYLRDGASVPAALSIDILHANKQGALAEFSIEMDRASGDALSGIDVVFAGSEAAYAGDISFIDGVSGYLRKFIPEKRGEGTFVITATESAGKQHRFEIPAIIYEPLTVELGFGKRLDQWRPDAPWFYAEVRSQFVLDLTLDIKFTKGWKIETRNYHFTNPEGWTIRDQAQVVALMGCTEYNQQKPAESDTYWRIGNTFLPGQSLTIMPGYDVDITLSAHLPVFVEGLEYLKCSVALKGEVTQSDFLASIWPKRSIQVGEFTVEGGKDYLE